MKKLLFVLAFVLAFAVSTAFAASSVTFEWNANAETDLADYRLYQSDVSVSTLDADSDGIITLEEYKVGPGIVIETIPAGTETVTIQVGDGTWYWVLTSLDTSDNESGLTAEVTVTLDSIPPATPGGFKITVIIKIESP